jgi:hypothetical protein
LRRSAVAAATGDSVWKIYEDDVAWDPLNSKTGTWAFAGDVADDKRNKVVYRTAKSRFGNLAIG